MSNYFFDSNQVRYQLYQTNGGKPYNWLFFPGGPGADSRYFHSLIDTLNLPGNVWLIDMPGTGSNVSDLEDFDRWIDFFPGIVEQFDNPVLVGHSFSGSFPLLFPELENSLKGFLILNSTPKLWLEEAAAYSKQFDLPDMNKELGEFALDPNPETFKIALDACMPYYFPKSNLEKGREMVMQMPFQYQPAVWWIKKASENPSFAKWIPKNVPTIIVGGKYDCMCPYTLFEKDERFRGPNMELIYMEDAGHFPWIDNAKATKDIFEKMTARLIDVDA